MSTHRCFVRILILVLFEAAFRCRCDEPQNQLKKCYEVGYNTFCFFTPDPRQKPAKWQEAWQTCRRSNATLPAITSDVAQDALERYLKFVELIYGSDFWMAGQEVRGQKWTWLDGSRTNKLTGRTRDDFVHAVLTSDMSYRAEIPSNRNSFFCQLNDTHCLSNDSIPFGEGCLLLNSKEVLNLYEARNRCVKDGGDLMVIENDHDFDRFREIITRIPNVQRVWMGLRRQWWIWNATVPTMEMKYSNWMLNDGFKKNRACMIVNANSFKWQQESCNNLKYFVCQTVEITPPMTSPEQFTILSPTSFIAFAVLGIFIPVLLVILAVVVRKRRKATRTQNEVPRALRDRSYQDMQDRQENIYTELRGITRRQSEQDPDYQNLSDYYHVAVISVPS